MLTPAGLYAIASAQVLLLVIALTHLEMLEQLLPFVRFDGYFALIALSLARRGVITGLRWSAGRPARRVLATVAGLAVLAALAATWTAQGQFHGW